MKSQFTPIEVFTFGLLGDKPAIDESTYLCKTRMLAVQTRVNPRNCIRYTEDKLAFFSRCVEHDLPTPRVVVSFGRTPFQSFGVPVAEGAEGLRALMADARPGEYVLKPVGGVYGRGILMLSFDGESFQEASGRSYTHEQLIAYSTQSEFSAWFLQERVYPHPALVALSATKAIQTARVVTTVSKTGEVEIPLAWLRIVGGGSQVDNFKFGEYGNLSAMLDIETGKLEYVLGASKAGMGLEEYYEHPSTGVPFSRFHMPCLEEVRDVVKRAAEAFKPLRTVGWDVAVTDRGPMLIEGNVNWGPLPTRKNLQAIAARLIE